MQPSIHEDPASRPLTTSPKQIGLIEELLRVGIDLALATSESGDTAASNFSTGAARRLCETAATILARADLRGEEADRLREDLSRLQGLLAVR